MAPNATKPAPIVAVDEPQAARKPPANGLARYAARRTATLPRVGLRKLVTQEPWRALGALPLVSRAVGGNKRL